MDFLLLILDRDVVIGLAIVGAIIAGLISGQATHSGLQSMPNLFSDIAIFSASIGLILILISRFLTKWVFGDKS